MNANKFSSEIYTFVEYAYQSIINNELHRQQIMEYFIKHKKLEKVFYGGTLIFDISALQKIASRKKNKITQSNQTKAILNNSVFALIEKLPDHHIAWNIMVVESQSLAHYASIAYEPNNEIYLFDSGWSSIHKKGIYNQVYKRVVVHLSELLKTRSLNNIINVSVLNNADPIQKCAPTESTKIDAFCQTWSLWWIMQFLSCKSARLSTHILYSLPRSVQSKIPLVLAVCIIHKTRIFNSNGKVIERLEDYYNYEALQKVNELMYKKSKNMNKTQVSYLNKVLTHEIPPLLLLMKNTNMSKNYNIRKEWNFPVYCSVTYFAKHPYL